MFETLRSAVVTLFRGIFLGLISLPLMADVISIRADEWYPFNGTPGSDKPGYMIEIAEKAFTAAGHQLDYQLLNWKRSLIEVRRGNFDCVVGAIKRNAPDFIFPTESMGKDDVAFFTQVDDGWRYQSIESIYQKRIGLISEYSYGDDIDNYVKNNPDNNLIHISQTGTPLRDNIKMLMHSRLDVIIESPYVFHSTVISLGLADKIQEAGRLNKPVDVYIACSPNKTTSKEYARLLSDSVIELRHTGELSEILQKYGISDWQ